MTSHRSWRRDLAAMLAALCVAAVAGAEPAPGEASAAGAREAARVASVVGSARAESADGRVRDLACGDVVGAGERVQVGPASRLGLLAGEAYAQVEARSTLRVDVTPEGAPQLDLESGRLRVVDARGVDSPPLGLGTPHASARGLGVDSELFVLSEKAGAYSLLCEWEAPLEVARNGEQLAAEPGQCVVANPREALYLTPAQAERVALAGEDACPVGPVLGRVADRFSPTDVAAAPPPTGLLRPAPPAFARDACDDPGAGCGGMPNLAPPPSFVLPPVTPPPPTFPPTQP